VDLRVNPRLFMPEYLKTRSNSCFRLFFEICVNPEYAAETDEKEAYMNPPAKLSDLILALDMPSEEFRTYFDRNTGAVVLVEETMLSRLENGEDEDLGDLAEWETEEYKIAKEIVNDDGSRFIPPPDKFEFHEYRVMEEFIHSIDDNEAANHLWRAIKGRGAFRYFKDVLHRLGIQQSWYDYLDKAQREFVIQWAKENNVVFEDDLQKRRK
jgi:hypothetical protein